MHNFELKCLLQHFSQPHVHKNDSLVSTKKSCHSFYHNFCALPYNVMYDVWMDGWKVVLKTAYSNKKSSYVIVTHLISTIFLFTKACMTSRNA
jgi:hypothetical protein